MMEGGQWKGKIEPQKNQHSTIHQNRITYSISWTSKSNSPSGSVALALPLPFPLFGHLCLLCKVSSNSPLSRIPGIPNLNQEPRMVVARTLWSERLWRSFKTVRPLCENPVSRSVEAAVESDEHRPINRAEE